MYRLYHDIDFLCRIIRRKLAGLCGGRVVGLVLALAVTGTSRLRFNDFCQNATGSFALAVTAFADTAAGILQYEY